MRHYEVREGDSLSAIAQRHGIAVADVLRANPRKARATLESGQQVFRSLAAGEEILVPFLGAVTPPAATPLPAHASCADGGTFHLNLCYYPGQFDMELAAPTCDAHYVWDKPSLSCLPDPSNPPPADATPAPPSTTSVDALPSWAPWTLAGLGIVVGIGLIAGAVSSSRRTS